MMNSSLRAAATWAALTALLAGCSGVDRQALKTAARDGGDFSFLSCDEIEAAEGSIGQRLNQIDVGAGEQGEARSLLEGNARDLAALKTRKGCSEVAQSVSEGAAESVKAPSPTTTTPMTTAANDQPTAREGRYLQVATVRGSAEIQRILAHYRQRGLTVRATPIVLAGRDYSRIVVGPILGRAELRRADDASAALGFDDSFFVNG